MTYPTRPDRRTILGIGTALAVAGTVPRSRAATLDGPWTRQGDIAVGGGSIHYAVLESASSNSEPLVLLPKLGGWIADWRQVAPLLVQRRTVIAIDAPGHGASVMAGAVPYIMTVGQSVAMILAALDQLGVDRCSIAGQSAGGIAGIVAASLWPARVRRLVLTAVSMIGPMSREALVAQDKAFVPGAPGSYRPDGRPVPQTAQQTDLFATIDPAITTEHDASRARSGLWLRPLERGIGRVGVTDYLPRVTQPALLLYADRGRYLKYVDVGKTLLRNHQSVTIANSGSFAAQERPAVWAAATNAFLDQPDAT